jgi:hypothetical protein
MVTSALTMFRAAPVTTIRPAGQTPIQPAAPQRSDATRQAAQKAFFELAMGKVSTTAAPAASAAPVKAAAPAAASPTPRRVAVTAAGEAPARTLRPGSLLDIRV